MDLTNIAQSLIPAILVSLSLLALRRVGPASLSRTGTLPIVVIGILVAIVGIFGSVIYDTQGKQGILAFGLMMLGSAAKWVWDGIKSRKNNDPLALDVADLVAPILVAPIVYGALLATPSGSSSSIQGTPDTKLQLASLIVAFQNGFFWKTVFDQAKPK